MGYDDDRNLIFIANIHDLANNLGLCGNVQGTGGLVGQQNLRAENHGHGNTHALAHTAGKLKGIAIHDVFRIGQTHIGQHLAGHFIGLTL